MKTTIFFLSLFTLFIACESTVNKQECKETYSTASMLLDKFYLNGQEKYLHFALQHINNVFDNCPRLRMKYVDLKVKILILTRNYKAGYQFIKSLIIEDFDKPYKKLLFLNTFKALLEEKQGDIKKRNKYLKVACTDIKNYISKNPMDKEAIADLFYTEVRFKSLDQVIIEINLMQKNYKFDNEFFNSLRETLKSIPEHMK